MAPPAYPHGIQTARGHLSRHLVGQGVEMGPGHLPFPIVMPGATVRYLDGWSPDRIGDLFPEIDGSDFVPADTVCDFNTEGLAPLAEESQDFIVASHVLEHLANPIRMLCEMHRVLRPGGTLLLFLPDRHNTFDKDRSPTPLAHLVDEFERGVTEVDDSHIEEFLHFTANHQGEGPPGTSSVPDPDLDLDNMTLYERSAALLWLRWDDVTVPAQRREVIDIHRKRSIHAHLWDVEEFFPVLHYVVSHLGHAWELVDGLLPGDPGGRHDEFAFVLRRAVAPRQSADQAAHLEVAWQQWSAYRVALRADMDQAQVGRDRIAEERAALLGRIEDLERSVHEAGEAAQTAGRAADEAIGIVHRLGQGREVARAEIQTASRRPGGDALPELIDLLLGYRNHPFRQGTRRQLGRLRRAVLARLRRP